MVSQKVNVNVAVRGWTEARQGMCQRFLLHYDLNVDVSL